MTVEISIIGLGQIGASIGLALAGQKEKIHRSGNDREPTVTRKAEKIGAIDQTYYNLPALVRQADVVILAVPVDEIRETLKSIALDLKEGAVVLDTTPVKSAVATWAAELLPPERHLVAWLPALNPAYLLESAAGIDAAHADLFKDSLVFITHPRGVNEQAVKLAADLATLVNARPFFADPEEVEGLLAANHMLPQLAAAAVLNVAQAQPGWDEGRKLAGQVFAQATQPLMRLDETVQLGQAILLNHSNVVRLLDNLITTLQDLREIIARQDGTALQTWLSRAVKGRETWLAERQENQWGLGNQQFGDLPTSGQVFGQFIGFGRRKERKQSK